MADTMVIDVKRISQPEHFAHFMSLISGDVFVSIIGRASDTYSKDAFLNELLSLMVEDDEVVECSSGDYKFILTGYDINWWKQSSRRYNKIFRAVAGEVVETKKVKSEKKYTVAAATLLDGKLSQIKTFEGTKDEVMTFFNNEITTRFLDEFLQMKVVLNLAYAEGDENDVSQWLTLDELKEIGAITL